MVLRINRRLIGKLSLFHFDDRDPFDGVVVRAHGEVAGDAGEVLGLGQGLGDLGAVQAAGLIDGRGQQEIRFSAQGGKGVQLFLI